MNKPSAFTDAERLESLKAAAVGGACAGIISVGLLIGYRVLGQGTLFALSSSFSGLAGRVLLVNWTFATASGALFALTYRYAVRRDQNLQLKAGVVLAFTLVRGLAQVDAASAIAQHFWPFLSACGQSLLIFGISAIVLELAFQNQWLAPFGKP